MSHVSSQVSLFAWIPAPVFGESLWLKGAWLANQHDTLHVKTYVEHNHIFMGTYDPVNHDNDLTCTQGPTVLWHKDRLPAWKGRKKGEYCIPSHRHIVWHVCMTSTFVCAGTFSWLFSNSGCRCHGICLQIRPHARGRLLPASPAYGCFLLYSFSPHVHSWMTWKVVHADLYKKLQLFHTCY